MCNSTFLLCIIDVHETLDMICCSFKHFCLMYICGAGHHYNRQMFDVESSMEEKGTAKQASA